MVFLCFSVYSSLQAYQAFQTNTRIHTRQSPSEAHNYPVEKLFRTASLSNTAPPCLPDFRSRRTTHHHYRGQWHHQRQRPKMATMPSLMAALRASSRAAPTTTRSAAAISAQAWGGRHDGGGGGGRGDGGGWSRSRATAEGGQGGWAMAAAAGLALAVGAGGAGSPREGAKNCGIVGVVSSAEKGGEGGVVEFLYEVRRAGSRQTWYHEKGCLLLCRHVSFVSAKFSVKYGANIRQGEVSFKRFQQCRACETLSDREPGAFVSNRRLVRCVHEFGLFVAAWMATLIGLLTTPMNPRADNSKSSRIFNPSDCCLSPYFCVGAKGLSILRNRGYDSAGVCTVDNDQELVVSKFASKGDSADSMELLQTNSASHVSHTVGIAHTRWATHGEDGGRYAQFWWGGEAGRGGLRATQKTEM